MAKANMDNNRCPMPTQEPSVRRNNFSEVALGYTEDMAIKEAERCLKKHWGKKRIAASLLEKGYCDGAIDTALSSLREEDLLNGCYAAAKKKFLTPPQTPAEKQKAYAALCRLGFSPDQIRFALQQLAAEHDEA